MDAPKIIYQKINIKLEPEEPVPVSIETKKILEERKVPPLRIKLEREEQRKDIEPVASNQEPLLLAGDLNSLLEQFEATEQVTVMTPSPPRPSSQTIRDSLPAEVINRIKVGNLWAKKNTSKLVSSATKNKIERGIHNFKLFSRKLSALFYTNLIQTAQHVVVIMIAGLCVLDVRDIGY